MLTVKFVCRNTFLVSHFLTIKTHTNEYLLKMNVLSDGSSLLSLCLQFSFSVMHSDILHIHVQHYQQQSLLKPEMYRIISLALHEYTLDILNLQISFSPWLLLRLPFFILALFENNSAFNILFVFGLLPCIGVISHPLFLSLCKGKMLYSVILTAWHCFCETVCPQHKACPRLPPLNVPFASANGQTVTVSDWTSCFFFLSFFHLISSVTLSVFLPVTCRVKEAVIGRLVMQLLTQTLISAHAGIGGRQFCMCVCVGQSDQHTNTILWIVGTQRTLMLCCFCASVDGHVSRRRTAKVRGSSVWDAAGQTQLDKQ